MASRASVELVLLEGGKAGEDSPEAAVPRGELTLVGRGPGDDVEAAIEETMAAARRIRQDIEERIARALDDLLRVRAPEQGPG